MQAQEAVKILHGRDALLGAGFMFEGAGHNSYKVSYPVNPDCAWHEPPAAIESCASLNSDTPLQTLWDEASRRLGGLDAIDLAREVVEQLDCPSCGRSRTVFQPVDRISDDQARCQGCGSECAPKFFHSIFAESPLLQRTVRQLGLPAWDIVCARRGATTLGLEIAGDNPLAGKGGTQSEPEPAHVEPI
jgi:hypothetical protein